MNGPQDGEGNNLWSRLRRRKVVQWGIAYAAGAWGLLQGLAYVSTAFHWPEQLQRIAILAFIGLPIVLVLAWYHGDRGEQRVGRAELAILTLLFLLGGGIFWLYHSTDAPTATTHQPAAHRPRQRTPTPAPPSPCCRSRTAADQRRTRSSSTASTTTS